MSLVISRDQRIVSALYPPKEGAKDKGSIDRIAEARQSAARARALPTMVLRHGVMLTLEYLDAKVTEGPGEVDEHGLATLLRKGLRAALPMLSKESDLPWPQTSDLASMSPIRYIAVQDAAIVVATWIKRLVEARMPEQSPTMSEKERR